MVKSMQDKPTFKIEKDDLSDIDKLIQLAKTYYKDGDIVNEEYLTWQYLSNPYGKPFLFTAKENETAELAGQYLVIPLKYMIKGKDVLGTLSLNTLTHPKYQGRGLFKKMATETYNACTDNNVNFTIGFPNPQSYPGFVKRLEFKHLGDIPLLIKPLSFVNIIFSYFRKNKKKHAGEIPINLIDHPNIKELNPLKDESNYKEFWESICKQYNLSTNKDLSFLKWRYYDIPTRNYKVLVYRNENKIEGLIILRSENVWGFRVGLIMDILVKNNDPAIGKSFLSHARKIFKASKIDFIAALHSDTNEYSLLKRNGFYSLPQKVLPQKIHFIVRLNKQFDGSEVLFDLQNWKLTFGDYDVF